MLRRRRKKYYRMKQSKQTWDGVNREKVWFFVGVKVRMGSLVIRWMENLRLIFVLARLFFRDC